MPDAFRMQYFEIQNPSTEITQGEVRKDNNLKISNLRTFYIQMCNIKTSFYGIITGQKNCKRRPFRMPKTVYNNVKRGISQCEMPRFTHYPTFILYPSGAILA